MQRLIYATGMLALPSCALALGIRLFDHDAFATARGDAFVATADNPSAVYYNPAGITQLRGHQVRGGVYAVNVESEFESRGGRDLSTRDEMIPLPGVFYTYDPESLPLTFGAGYYLPFGLSLEWPDRSPFRNVTIRGELQYHTLAGVAAWEILPGLSLAAGPTFNYAFTDLARGIAAPGDEFRFRGDAMDWGAVAGIFWHPLPRHAFGVSYRSPTKMDFEGKSRVTPYPVPVQRASTRLPFPQVVTAGYSFRPTTNWNLEVNVDWTDWERVNTPVLKQSTGNVPLPLEWDSSWAVEAGATRYLRRGLHVSAGYVFIQNSVPTRSYTPIVPDQDLHVFSAGVGGKSAKLTWDATYQFTFGPERSVAGSLYGPAVAGNYTFINHAIALSIGYHF